MKLTPDCIRDILLKCEEQCTPNKCAIFEGKEDFTYNEHIYSNEETLYHLRQCEMNEYFSRSSEDWNRNFYVKDLTPKAHEFLANTRTPSVWDKTKSTAK